MQFVGGKALAGDALRGAGHLPDGLHHALGASSAAAPLEQEHHALRGQHQRQKPPQQQEVRAGVRLAGRAAGRCKTVRCMVKPLVKRADFRDAGEAAPAPRGKPGVRTRFRAVAERAHRDDDQDDVRRQHRGEKPP